MRILWIKSELLHPVDKGGKIRTYQMLRALARHHRVTYLCLDDGTAATDAIVRAREYAHETVVVPFTPPAKGSARFYGALAANLLSPLPYAIARYCSAAWRAQISKLAEGADLIVCDFLTPSPNIARHLSNQVVLFQHNVEAMIWKRHAEVPQNPLRRASRPPNVDGWRMWLLLALQMRTCFGLSMAWLRFLTCPPASI